MLQEDGVRKRPRSVSPTPGNQATSPFPRNVQDNSLGARLRDPLLRNGALNELMKLTVKHDKNYSLNGDSTLDGLAAVFFEVIEWRPLEESDSPVFHSQRAWTCHPTKESAAFSQFCKRKLSKGNLSPEKRKYLDSVVVIIRNLSFVAANLRLLAYSPRIMQILVGSLYESANSKNCGGDDFGTNSSTSGLLALSALNTLVNLAPYLDVTGQKMLCDKLFYSVATSEEAPVVPSAETFGQAANGAWGFGSLWLAKRFDTKEDIVHDISPKLLRLLTQEHIVAVWSIFPALAEVLTDSTASRLVIMTAVELLQEFINHARVGVVGSVEDQEGASEIPNARAILVHVPSKTLERLTGLLHIPRLGPDALEYVDPLHNIVPRVTTLKLLMGYDATVDTDVRDRALDVLVPLMELDSPRMAIRLGTESSSRSNNCLFDAIFPILSTKVGRNEAPLLATQLLRELSKAQENRGGFLYIQERLLELASKDARVAQLVFNHLQACWKDDMPL